MMRTAVRAKGTGMDSGKLLCEALVASLLALATSSAVHAHTPQPLPEPTEDLASARGLLTGPATISVSFDLLADGGKIFGEFRRSTSPFGETATSTNSAPGLWLLGPMDAKKLHGGHQLDVASNSAVPEQSTYLLLALGLVGIALVSHRRHRYG